MHPQIINNYLNENNLYSVNSLSKSLGIGRTSLNRIIKIYNLKSKSVKFKNLNLYDEKTKLEIIELIKTTSRYLNHHSKDKVEGYIKINTVGNYFKPEISCNKVKTLISYYNLNPPIKHKGILYMKIEDFEFLKKLPNEKIYSHQTHFKLEKEINSYLNVNNCLTINGLAEKFNVSINTLNYLMSNKDINLPYEIYKGVHIYNEECQKILKEYLEKKNKFIYTKTSMSKYLGYSLGKIKNYLNYLIPTEDEYDGKCYTQKFVDKMQQLIKDYPILMQNKVYVKGYNICFDSKCEAIFYVYLKEHGYNVIYHPIKFEYMDSKGKKRKYEVDFSVEGRLIELKGNNQFDNNGKPIYKGKSWQEKYDCMIKNNV